MTTQRKRPRRSWGKLRRRASGRWEASYQGPDLARHSAPVTYTAKMDGEAWLASERKLIERGDWTPPSKRSTQRHAKAKTLRAYASEWIETRNLKPRTKFGYEELIGRLIDPKLGNQVLGAISAETVRGWHASLGTATPRRNSHAYGLLHAILATAVADGLITTNPCQIKRAMNPPTKRQAVILTVDEIAKLANVIQPGKLKALVLVSSWCGLRWGEVTELRRRDIAADCSMITVARAVTHRNGECLIDTPTSGKGRPVEVPPHIQSDLREHLELYVGNDADALLFTAQRSCHFHERTFRDAMAPALKSIGRGGVRIHDLRHFAGSQAARVGNLVETMNRLGHSTAKASLIYQHMVSGRDREMAEALSALAQVPENTG